MTDSGIYQVVRDALLRPAWKVFTRTSSDTASLTIGWRKMAVKLT